MIRMVVRAAVGLLLVTLVACSAEHANSSATRQQDVLEVNSSSMLLADMGREDLESKARSGDVDAAYQLGRYFAETPAEWKASIAWFTVAAEKGHRSAMHELALRLVSRGGAEACASAIRWAEKWSEGEPRGSAERSPDGKTHLSSSVDRACRPDTASSANPLRMGLGFIGPLKLGMSEQDVQALNLPNEREVSGSEVGDIIVYSIHLDPATTVDMTFERDGSSSRISTTSSVFTTVEGARVGDALLSLQQRFPNGEVAKGLVEEIYFNFLLCKISDPCGARAAFGLDHSGLTDGCLRQNVGCPDLGARRSKYFDTWR